MLLVGTDPPEGAARRFDSREASEPARRPRLEILYHEPGMILKAGFEAPLCPD